MHQLARAKTRRIQRACGAPVVLARALGFVDWAGAGKHARHGRATHQGREPAKRITTCCARRFLALLQFVLARDRQPGQCRAAVHIRGVHPREDAREGCGVPLRVGDLLRHCGHQRCLAGGWVPGFKRVVEVAHGGSALRVVR